MVSILGYMLFILYQNLSRVLLFDLFVSACIVNSNALVDKLPRRRNAVIKVMAFCYTACNI